MVFSRGPVTVRDSSEYWDYRAPRGASRSSSPVRSVTTSIWRDRFPPGS